MARLAPAVALALLSLTLSGCDELRESADDARRQQHERTATRERDATTFKSRCEALGGIVVQRGTSNWFSGVAFRDVRVVSQGELLVFMRADCAYARSVLHDINSVRPRLTELKEQRLVKRGMQRKCGETGKSAFEQMAVGRPDRLF